jgi:hypothetical protein
MVTMRPPRHKGSIPLEWIPCVTLTDNPYTQPPMMGRVRETHRWSGPASGGAPRPRYSPENWDRSRNSAPVSIVRREPPTVSPSSGFFPPKTNKAVFFFVSFGHGAMQAGVLFLAPSREEQHAGLTTFFSWLTNSTRRKPRPFKGRGEAGFSPVSTVSGLDSSTQIQYDTPILWQLGVGGWEGKGPPVKHQPGSKTGSQEGEVLKTGIATSRDVALKSIVSPHGKGAMRSCQDTGQATDACSSVPHGVFTPREATGLSVRVECHRHEPALECSLSACCAPWR